MTTLWLLHIDDLLKSKVKLFPLQRSVLSDNQHDPNKNHYNPYNGDLGGCNHSWHLIGLLLVLPETEPGLVKRLDVTVWNLQPKMADSATDIDFVSATELTGEGRNGKQIQEPFEILKSIYQGHLFCLLNTYGLTGWIQVSVGLSQTVVVSYVAASKVFFL